MTNNYARPAPRARADALPGLERRCAPIHAYVFFDDAGGVPVEVLNEPSAWVLHHVPDGYHDAVASAGVVGVDPNGEAPDAAPRSDVASAVQRDLGLYGEVTDGTMFANPPWRKRDGE